MHRKRVMRWGWVFTGILVLVVLAFIFFFDSVFLQPASGNVAYLGDISTNRISNVMSNVLGETVYFFDGASMTRWDFDGDSLTESLIYAGDRLLYLDHDGTELLAIDGTSGQLWRRENAHVVRIADDPANPNKYVVVKSGPNNCGTFCNTWDYSLTIEGYALGNFNGYTLGQKIFDVDYTPSETGDSISWIFGDVIASPTIPATIIASQRDYGRANVYHLTVSLAGVIGLTSTAELGCPVYSNPNALCHRGNGGLYTTLCRVNANGVNTGVCEKYFFNNHVFRISSAGTLTEVGSWFSANGDSIPIVQGGTRTINFVEGDTNNHADTSLVINRGTETNPDPWLYIQYDGNGAETWAARISVNQNGVFTLTPQFATWGGNYGTTAGASANEIALVNKVKGLSGGPYIINGRWAFDLDGNIVADMNDYKLDWPKSWPARTDGEYLLNSLFGFAAQPSSPLPLLAHVLPAVGPNDPDQTWQFGNFPGGLPAGPSPTKSGTYGGVPVDISPSVEIDASGNVRVRLIKIRDQRYASRFKANDEQIVWTITSQEQRDLLFGFAQHHTIPAGRGFDSYTFQYELSQSTPSLCAPGSTQSCITGLSGICASGTQTCSAGGTWGTCVAPSPQTEICTNSLDDDCDGLVNEICIPNAPSGLGAIVI